MTSNENSKKVAAVGKVNPLVHFMAGGVGGTIGAVITCPLEVVKTRQQSSTYHKNGSGRGIVFMLKEIRHNEGIRGLWKGLGPNLLGVIPSRAIYFSTYASAKQYFTHDLRLNSGRESSLIHLISAATAGFTTATFTNPIWLIKTRMQLQNQRRQSSPNVMSGQSPVNKSLSSQSQSSSSSSKNINGIMKRQAHGMSIAVPAPSPSGVYYKNSFDCMIQVVKQEGVKGLFRGLTASYLGIAEQTMQWVVYEKLKKSMRQFRGTADGDHVQMQQQSQMASQMVDNLLVAGVAKFIASISTYPHEVLRTRMRQVTTINSVNAEGRAITIGQPKYSGMTDVVKQVWRTEGLLAFYGGLGAHLLRTVPNAAIMFFCYESIIYLANEKLQL
ncbi:hypothetical protein MIR68_007153 [Amoeboaphelidium protococcarum]|nr:hypothetical protein MIR68_007153 [Amoeboaphelidium protococcarum]